MNDQLQTPAQKKTVTQQERRLFRLVLKALVILLVSCFVPILGLVVFIPLFCVGLLWCYAGLTAGCITFLVWFFLARHKGFKSIPAGISAARWSVIVFGAIGLVLLPSVLVIPGYKTFTLGHWIHAKAWLNVVQVRKWAAEQETPAGPRHGIPYKEWPMSLKVANWGSGSLLVDPNTKAVTVVDGGGFGHWGIYIAPIGTTEPRLGGYNIQLEDGAWVSTELQ